jgi:hypothetical protein
MIVGPEPRLDELWKVWAVVGPDQQARVALKLLADAPTRPIVSSRHIWRDCFVTVFGSSCT